MKRRITVLIALQASLTWSQEVVLPPYVAPAPVWMISPPNQRPGDVGQFWRKLAETNVSAVLDKFKENTTEGRVLKQAEKTAKSGASVSGQAQWVKYNTSIDLIKLKAHAKAVTPIFDVIVEAGLGLEPKAAFSAGDFSLSVLPAQNKTVLGYGFSW